MEAQDTDAASEPLAEKLYLVIKDLLGLTGRFILKINELLDAEPSGSEEARREQLIGQKSTLLLAVDTLADVALKLQKMMQPVTGKAPAEKAIVLPHSEADIAIIDAFLAQARPNLHPQEAAGDESNG